MSSAALSGEESSALSAVFFCFYVVPNGLKRGENMLAGGPSMVANGVMAQKRLKFLNRQQLLTVECCSFGRGRKVSPNCGA